MVWIEIMSEGQVNATSLSPPSRWCGLKYIKKNCIYIFCVTTFAVVWIEIYADTDAKSRSEVTTFAVVWIEMARSLYPPASYRVTTFAVVWIEIVHR